MKSLMPMLVVLGGSVTAAEKLNVLFIAELGAQMKAGWKGARP